MERRASEHTELATTGPVPPSCQGEAAAVGFSVALCLARRIWLG